MGFAWDKLQADWDKKYDLCVRFLSKNETNKISKSTFFEGINIGRWLLSQQKKYNEGKLSKEKREKIEALNIIWDIREDQWQKKYNLCSCYLAQTGVKRIPESTVFEGVHIGDWIMTQKEQNKIGKLSVERKEKLLKLIPDLFS